MDIETFREIVDHTSAEIVAIRDQPEELYAYVGLAFEGIYQRKNVCAALDDRVRAAFKVGHRAVSNLCHTLLIDLIREHVILDVPLDPYYDLLVRLRDAARQADVDRDTDGNIDGDWETAIKAARDSIEISNYSTSTLRALHAREYNVAESAKALKQAGYAIRLETGFIAVEETAEISLVAEIERLVAAIGGINIARTIFKHITSAYDSEMGRYHIVPQISSVGGGDRQIPFGYILQLAVKHLEAQEPAFTHDASWKRLIELTTSYAAVIDVQPYYHVWASMDAKALLKYLQEQALYDSLFRFPQLRASDVLKICRGAFSFLDPEKLHPDGWTLSQAFEVIGHLTDPRHDIRGPVIVKEEEVRRALPHIPRPIVSTIMRDVLSHPHQGANQRFSLPTDAPTPEDKTKGADFNLKPLICRPGNKYLILDRSMCGWSYVEALLTAFRPLDRELDTRVGMSIERFVEREFLSHGVEVFSGDYDEGGHGECDIALSTPDALIFLEMKKKALTRRARAGNDAELLLDLAGSLLDAHAQAGWHELRITKAGFLDLARNGETRRLSLEGRGIEKIALGMLDFGSFQDRMVLKQFLEATLNASFQSADSAYEKKFQKINSTLGEIRQQYNTAFAGQPEARLPFFNCWFMSIPQLLILLDKVADSATFKRELWSCRSITTGTSDFYFEISNMRRIRKKGAVDQ